MKEFFILIQYLVSSHALTFALSLGKNMCNSTQPNRITVQTIKLHYISIQYLLKRGFVTLCYISNYNMIMII